MVSVITMVSLGEGVKHRVLGQINQLGAELITVRPGKLVNRNAEGEITGVNLLAGATVGSISDKDIQTIAGSQGVESVVPMSIVSGAATVDTTQLDDTAVIATTEKFPTIIGQKVAYGSFFTNDEYDRRAVVVGSSVAENAFKELVPIGRKLTISK